MSIEKEARSCYSTLRDCLQRAEVADHDFQALVETQLDRFVSWISNINALADVSSKSSLAFRVRQAPKVSCLIVSIVQTIQQRVTFCLNRLIPRCSDCRNRRLEGSYDPEKASPVAQLINCNFVFHDGKDQTDRLKAYMQAVAESITSLHKLSNTIRRATRDARNARIDGTFRLSDKSGRDIENDLRNVFKRIVKEHVPKAEMNLQDRFVDTMILRRKRAAYRGMSTRRSVTPAMPVTQQTPLQVSTSNQLLIPRTAAHGGQITQRSTRPSGSVVSHTSGKALVQDWRPGSPGSQANTATTVTDQLLLKAPSGSTVSTASRQTIAQTALSSLPFPPRPRMYDRTRYLRLKQALAIKNRERIHAIRSHEVSHLRTWPCQQPECNISFQTTKNLAAERKRYRAERLDAKKRCNWGGGTMTCPFCELLFDRKAFSTEDRWRTHVLHDIKAYVCIAPACEQTTEMFATSKDWLVHMQLHNKKWHCDAPNHAPAIFNTELDYKLHMVKAHREGLAEYTGFDTVGREGEITDRLLEDEELQFLAEINAWVDDPMYKECPLCEQDVGEDLGDVHIIDHIRYLALSALPDVREHLDASTNEGSVCSSHSNPAKTRTTITKIFDSGDAADAIVMEPIISQPDDDLIFDINVYAGFGGYDAFIARYPRGEGGLSLAAERMDSSFPFPSEAVSTAGELDRDGNPSYPKLWPADRSVNFTRPPAQQTRHLLDYEWQGIINGLNLNHERADLLDMRNVQDKLRQTLQTHQLGLSGSTKGFIPEELLNSLVPESFIRSFTAGSLPDEHNARSFANFFCTEALKPFAIVLLTFSKKESIMLALRSLFYHQLIDHDLPVVWRSNLSGARDTQRCRSLGSDLEPCQEDCTVFPSDLCEHDISLTAFHHDVWFPGAIQRFSDAQWSFYVPSLRSAHIVELSQDDNRLILPFIQIADEDGSKIGGVRKLLRAKMLFSHQDTIAEDEACTDDNGIKWIHVVIDRMTFSLGDYDSSRRETLTFLMTSDFSWKPHHILPKIGAFSYPGLGVIQLVCPWASGGSLPEFWAKHPSPQLTSDLILDALHQLHGICNALNFVHNEGFLLRNLQPKKILVFENQRGKLGTLKIDVWGTLMRRENAHQNSEESDLGGMPTRLSQAFDIWSLGCIFYEMIMWLLYGNEMVTKSGSEEVGTDRIDVLGRVLRYDPECTSNSGSALRALAELVRGACLVTNPAQRAAARTLDRELANIIVRASSHPSYLFTGRDRAGLISPSAMHRHVDSNIRSMLLKRLPQNSDSPSTSAPLGSRPLSESDVNRQRVRGAARPATRRPLEPLFREGDAVWVRQRQAGNRPPVFGTVTSVLTTAGNSWKYMVVASNGTRIENVAEKDLTRGYDDGGRESSSLLPEIPDTATAVSSENELRALGSNTWQTSEDNQGPMTAWERIIDLAVPEVILNLPAVEYGLLFDVREVALCERCNTLDLANPVLHFMKTTPEMEVSTQEGCQLCDLLLRASRSTNAQLHHFERRPMGLLVDTNNTVMLRLCADFDEFDQLDRSGRRPEKKRKELEIDNLPMGVPRISPSGSKGHFAVIREWLDDCQHWHVQCVPYGTSRPPKRIVQVLDAGSYFRVVDWGATGSRYAALSHCWGRDVGNVYMTKSNMETFMLGRTPVSSLPATLRDAIITTHSLGLEYLWVDALCIVMDDQTEWQEDVAKMGDIFHGAFCVLAASRAESMTEGFLGERKTVRCAKISHGQDSLGTVFVSDLVDDFEQDVLKSRLHNRGWTLLERALARRTIYFTDAQTYFECGDGIRCETLTKLHNDTQAFLGDANFPNASINLETSKDRAASLIHALYSYFSGMDFSYPVDKPIAISGVEQRLAAALGTQSIAGVMETLKSRSLLWARDEAQSRGLKRIDSAGRQRPMPSWSWMAYVGRIRFPELPSRLHWNYGDDDSDSRVHHNVHVLDSEDIHTGAKIQTLAYKLNSDEDSGHFRESDECYLTFDMPDMAPHQFFCVILASGYPIPRSDTLSAVDPDSRQPELFAVKLVELFDESEDGLVCCRRVGMGVVKGTELRIHCEVVIH